MTTQSRVPSVCHPQPPKHQQPPANHLKDQHQPQQSESQLASLTDPMMRGRYGRSAPAQVWPPKGVQSAPVPLLQVRG